MNINNKEKRFKASYTIEAAIYVPFILYLLFQSLDLAIDFWQESREREVCEELQRLDIVSEFYGYHIVDETWKEIQDD